ncbi:MAG: L,D-transpeptidase family protein [Fimbriimonas sp.]
MRIPLLVSAILMILSCQAPAEDRVADARRLKLAALRRDFGAAGLAYPAPSVYLRAFKRERILEVWVGSPSGRMKNFRTYPILAASGGLGPKVREGDRQVPEGFYTINRFNPRSSFLLSLGLDYPNRRDRLRREPKPGGDIFIHGNEVSIGCLAMGDDAIREIYLIARDTPSKPIHVHVFPSRMDVAGWQALQTEGSPELRRYWATLRPGYLQFERTRRVPKTAIRNGDYVVLPL